MTTIACNSKLRIMAADRKVISGDLYFPSTKIFRIGSDLVGACGNPDYCEKFFEWFKKQRGKPPKIDDTEFDGLVLNKTGIYLYGGLCVPIKVDRDFDAIGSGALGALVAMEDGADPKTAIEKTHKFDNNTSFETDVLEL